MSSMESGEDNLVQYSVNASRCSRCGIRFFDGELIGLQKRGGQQFVLCCMCLDLKTARFEIFEECDAANVIEPNEQEPTSLHPTLYENREDGPKRSGN